MKKDEVVNYYDSIASSYDESRFNNSYGRFIDAQERRVKDQLIPHLRTRKAITAMAKKKLFCEISPLTITEMHHHSDALAPDPDNKHVPYSAGTSVNYNFIDLRFRNDTDRPIQICTWCDGDNLNAALCTTDDSKCEERTNAMF